MRRSSATHCSIRSSPPVTPASAMNEPISMWSGETACSQPPSASRPWTCMTLDPIPSIAAPMRVSMRARSCTWGSEAALRMIVEPGVRAAAMSAFSVPITDGSSMKKSHATQAAVGSGEADVPIELDAGAERTEGVQVRVQPAAPDHVAARRRQQRRAEAREQRPADEDGGADALGQGRVDVRRADGVGLEHDRVRRAPLDLHAQGLEQDDQRVAVADLRHVVEHDRVGRQQARGQQRQGRVLVARGHDGAGQRHAAFDDELLHKRWERLVRTGAGPALKLG